MVKIRMPGLRFFRFSVRPDQASSFLTNGEEVDFERGT
jgi:hypothetical protein